VLRDRVDDERIVLFPSAERETPLLREDERVAPVIRVLPSMVREFPPVRMRVPSVRTV
jgi:hypothetical protein